MALGALPGRSHRECDAGGCSIRAANHASIATAGDICPPSALFVGRFPLMVESKVRRESGSLFPIIALNGVENFTPDNAISCRWQSCQPCPATVSNGVGRRLWRNAHDGFPRSSRLTPIQSGGHLEFAARKRTARLFSGCFPTLLLREASRAQRP